MVVSISPHQCKRYVVLVHHSSFAHYVCQFGTLQFGKFEDIVEKGYKSGLKTLRKWKEEGKVPIVAHEGVERGKRKGRGLRRNSI
jgi:lysophospholipid hydrolase